MVYKKKVKFSKKSKPLSKTEYKAVAKIAKKVSLQQAETKSAPWNNSVNPGAPDIYRVQNLNYFMAQGTSDTQYIGTSIFLKNINIKLNLNRVGSANLAGAYNDAVTARIMVFKTKQQLTATQASTTVSNIYRDDGATVYNAMLRFPDLDKVNVLYDRKIDMSNNNAVSTTVASPSNHKLININLKINKKHTWDADNSGYFKYQNYYLLVHYSCESVAVPNYITAYANWVINFKDE